ncbi:MAG: carbohydrate-binding domain-containing protein [Clostridia bacterium]|nr:carbohydrate-binding domain-containing protein [Clostridia bacterium]
MKIKLIALALCFLLLLTGCSEGTNSDNGTREKRPDLGDDDKTFGEPIDELGAYDGYFEGASTDIVIECISGTDKAYKLEGTTLTFTTIGEKTVYSISGTFKGNIVIDVGDSYKFDLELHGFSLVCDSTNPITVKSGDEVAIKAKKETKNYIYDQRDAIDSTDDTLYSAAVYSAVDLEIGGKGELTVVSESNNGIHSKDDLQVKNLTLLVACIDNALKGNDSVEVTGGNTTLIASGGDCIKTTNSDISEKGNQRGTVSIVGGTHTLYAACDGIDAAYDAVIDDSTTVLNIYTDKYSNYSKEVIANSSDTNYIRFTSNRYYYSVKYYNSDTDYVWVNAEYHSAVSGGMSTYYYYSYPKMPDYAKQQFFIYEAASQQGQEEDYLVKSEYLTPNSGSDTFALTQSYNGLYYEWTNYTTKIQENGFGRPGGMGGPGGMQDGNTDKGDHSTKGIKAANEILINAGTISIKSYDDAIHANNDTALENGASPLGNVTINDGTITVYSNDDGLHADGTLSIKAGTVCVTNAYEGLEGAWVNISGGQVSVISKDDGINGTGTGEVITVSGGSVYIYAGGDGVDAGSDMSGTAKILFSGGDTVIISTSGGNSAIDTNSGYTQSGNARVIAIMPTNAMTSESTHGNAVGATVNRSISLTQNGYLTVTINTDTIATIKMPKGMTAYVIYLGSNSATIASASSSSVTLDENGVAWN